MGVLHRDAIVLAEWNLAHLPFRRRRKYRRHENRLLTIKEKCEAGDYTLGELVKAFSNWVSF